MQGCDMTEHDIDTEAKDAALIVSEYMLNMKYADSRDIIAAFMLTRNLSKDEQLECFEDIRQRIDAALEEDADYIVEGEYHISGLTIIATALIVVSLSAVGVGTLLGLV